MGKKINFKSLIFSIKFFFIIQYKNRNYDVLMLSPSHFNRSSNNKNLYFEKICHTLKANNVSYIFFEENSLYDNNFRSSDKISFDLINIMIAGFSKMNKMISEKIVNNFKRKFLKYIFRNLSIKNIITISNSFLDEFCYIYEDVNVFDLQHGVIYPSHRGYRNFNIKSFNYKLFLSGSLYLDKIQNYDNKDNRLIVLGHPYINKRKNKEPFRNEYILFTSSLEDEKPDIKEAIERENIILKTCLESISKSEKKIILKPHPRSQAKYYKNLLKSRKIIISNEDLSELVPNIFLHITINSSSIFEVSSAAVPSYIFSYLEEIDQLFFDTFQFPLKRKNNLNDQINQYLNNENIFLEDSKSVFEWYWSNHQEFSGEVLMKSLRLN